jgi:hypothetical protein
MHRGEPAPTLSFIPDLVTRRLNQTMSRHCALPRQVRLAGMGKRLAALLACWFVAHAHAQPFDRDDPRARLIRALGLVDAQRAALDGTALPLSSRGRKYAGLKACIDGKSTDARLEGELASALQASLPSRDSAAPVLRFLETPAGKSFVAAIALRNRVAFPQRAVPARRSIVIAGVIMYSDEVSDQEARHIDGFVRSDEGKPLREILAATGGFGQLTRTIEQMNRMAAECGIDLK